MMKNIFKWFLGLIIVLAMVAGLEMAKLTLLSPGPMDFENHEVGGLPLWHGGPPPPEAFHPGDPDMAGHPDFGPPSAEMKLKFALADAANILIYVVLFVPLLYGAFQLGRRAFNLPGFNTVIRSSAYSDDSSTKRDNDDSSRRETDVTLSASDEYSVLDNHLLDQLL